MSDIKYKYELKFKTAGFPWKVFDTYKTINDLELKKYHDLLNKTKFNDGVEIIKIETTRTKVVLPK
jgi:hypothetical protein